MKRRNHAFTLVELALAIGIAAGTLSILIALLPIGIANDRESRRSLTANHLLAVVAHDLMTAADDQKTSSIFAFDLSPDHSSSQTFDLDENAGKVDHAAPENYHVRLVWIAAEPHDYKAQQARIEISWPASTDPLTAKSQGQFVETVIALNRKP